jgi:hypothetical protein
MKAPNGHWKGKECKAPGCDEPAAIKGWCTGHYDRLRRTGSIADQRARLGLVYLNEPSSNERR